MAKQLSVERDCASFPVMEAEAMNEYLIARGISPKAILIEPLSSDTIQNAYYSRILPAEPGHFSLMTFLTCLQIAS